MNSWLFQANPKRYDLLAAAEKGFEEQWSMNQHRDEVAVGDRIFFFLSKPNAGIYVVGKVVSPLYEAEAQDEFGRYKVDVEYEAVLDPYISRSVLTDPNNAILASFRPFRGLQGTNFFIPPEVAAQLDLLAAPRLRPISKKAWQGADLSLHAVDKAIKEHGDQVRARLLAALKELDPYVFEGVIGMLLGRLGYEDAVVTTRSSDKGIDLTATLRLEGITEVPTVIQAKRFTTRNVDGGVVRELRGALTPGQHGVIMTTSGFTKDAHSEATALGKTPIALVDGRSLVDLLIKKGLGVQTRPVPLFTLNIAALLAERGDER